MIDISRHLVKGTLSDDSLGWLVSIAERPERFHCGAWIAVKNEVPSTKRSPCKTVIVSRSSFPGGDRDDKSFAKAVGSGVCRVIRQIK